MLVLVCMPVLRAMARTGEHERVDWEQAPHTSNAQASGAGKSSAAMMACGMDGGPGVDVHSGA